MDLRTERELLTPTEVAEILRVPRSTVLHWGRTGELRAVHFGKHVRFVTADLRARLRKEAEKLEPHHAAR